MNCSVLALSAVFCSCLLTCSLCSTQRHFFFYWDSSSNHCLAALDLGVGVEQSFDCLIVQNRQAVQYMRRSMDWILEDMVDGLSTLTDRRGGHTHMYKQERKRLTPVRRRLLWEPAYDIFVLRFWPKKTAVFGCLTNALAPPPIALESYSRAQTDRPVF